jgi:hypothetical protein
MTKPIITQILELLSEWSTADTDEVFYKFTAHELFERVKPLFPTLKYKYLDRIVTVMRKRGDIVMVGKVKTEHWHVSMYQYRFNRGHEFTGITDSLVPADRAREHIFLLSEFGVGRRAISECTDIDQAIIGDIKHGRHKRIRESTEKKILAVNTNMLADSALVDSAESMRYIAEMMDMGYDKKQLAEMLSYPNKNLRFKSSTTITARNAARIKKLYLELKSKHAERDIPAETTTHKGAILTFERKGSANVITHRMAA